MRLKKVISIGLVGMMVFVMIGMFTPAPISPIKTVDAVGNSGSGTAQGTPPTSDTDWTISADTTIRNQTFIVRNITVNSPYVLTLDNVTLYINTVNTSDPSNFNVADGSTLYAKNTIIQNYTNFWEGEHWAGKIQLDTCLIQRGDAGTRASKMLYFYEPDTGSYLKNIVYSNSSIIFINKMESDITIDGFYLHNPISSNGGLKLAQLDGITINRYRADFLYTYQLHISGNMAITLNNPLFFVHTLHPNYRSNYTSDLYTPTNLAQATCVSNGSFTVKRTLPIYVYNENFQAESKLVTIKNKTGSTVYSQNINGHKDILLTDAFKNDTLTIYHNPFTVTIGSDEYEVDFHNGSAKPTVCTNGVNPRLSKFPWSYDAAFTITIDTDNAEYPPLKTFFDYVDGRGIKLSYFCWALDVEYEYRDATNEDTRPWPVQTYSDTLNDTDFKELMLEMWNAGWEVSIHTIGAGNETRSHYIYGYPYFESIFGDYPRNWIDHSINADDWDYDVCWGDDPDDPNHNFDIVTNHSGWRRGGAGSTGYIFDTWSNVGWGGGYGDKWINYTWLGIKYARDYGLYNGYTSATLPYNEQTYYMDYPSSKFDAPTNYDESDIQELVENRGIHCGYTHPNVGDDISTNLMIYADSGYGYDISAGHTGYPDDALPSNYHISPAMVNFTDDLLDHNIWFAPIKDINLYMSARDGLDWNSEIRHDIWYPDEDEQYGGIDVINTGDKIFVYNRNDYSLEGITLLMDRNITLTEGNNIYHTNDNYEICIGTLDAFLVREFILSSETVHYSMSGDGWHKQIIRNQDGIYFDMDNRRGTPTKVIDFNQTIPLKVQTIPNTSIIINSYDSTKKDEYSATIMSFTADSTDGNNVVFTISDLTPNRQYVVYRDGGFYKTLTANSGGIISFGNSEWSSHGFSIHTSLMYEDDDDHLPTSSPEIITTQRDNIFYFDVQWLDLWGVPNFKWDFGDGVGSNSSGVHIYQEDGVYVVSLWVLGNDGNWTRIDREITVGQVDETSADSYSLRHPFIANGNLYLPFKSDYIVKIPYIAFILCGVIMGLSYIFDIKTPINDKVKIWLSVLLILGGLWISFGVSFP